MVGAVGVFANLHDAEEAVAVHSKLAVDLSVDLEGHSSTLLLQFAMLVLQRRVVVVVLRIVNSSIKNHPVGTCLGALKVPVTEHVCG